MLPNQWTNQQSHIAVFAFFIIIINALKESYWSNIHSFNLSTHFILVKSIQSLSKEHWM